MVSPRIVMFCRYPEAGKAKTRLIPALGAQGAADLHRKLSEQTISVLQQCGAAIEVRHTGADISAFRAWLGDDLRFVEQGTGDLGDRMKAASEPPVVFVGTDCPDLTAEHIADAVAALEDAPITIGPAEDGGYWLLGFSEHMDFLFHDMAWGTDKVLPETLVRLKARGIQPALLETLADCDRPEDLARWPELTA